MLAFGIAGCGDSGDGGSNGSGAGVGATAGAPGGTAGTGGSDTGGAAGKAGGGSGGSSGGSGGGDAACSAPQYTHTFGFGALFEGWAISSFSTPSLVPMMTGGTGGTGGGGGTGGTSSGGASDAGDSSGGASDAGDSSGGTGGSSGGTSSGTVMELDTSDGSPDSPDGSLKLSIPFDGPAQLLLLGTVFNTGLNFQGTTLTAKIKLDSGLIAGPADTARANLVLKATDGYIYSAGPAVVLDPSAGWVTLTMDPEAPSMDALLAGFTPCQVREIDIEIRTGDTGSFRPAVVHIDEISVAPKTP